MKNKDSKKRNLRKLKDAKPIFEEEVLPEVKKDIASVLEKLDKELAKQKKIIADNDREILQTMTYEQFLQLIQLT